MKQSITYQRAKGSDLERLVGKMQHSLKGETNATHIMMACLSMALILQIPDISPEELVAGVKGSSEWIALFATHLEEPTLSVN